MGPFTYFLPLYTFHCYIGHLCYIYFDHICPLSYLVLLKLQLIRQWCAVVLLGAYLDLGLIYGALNSVFYHALYHNLLHCQYIVYFNLSLQGYPTSWHFVYVSRLHKSYGSIFHQFTHIIIFSHKFIINVICFYGPFDLIVILSSLLYNTTSFVPMSLNSSFFIFL